LHKRNKEGRDIHRLKHNEQLITDPEEIMTIMQQWYEKTAERTVLQMAALPVLLAGHNIELPQIDKDQQAVLEEEFSQQEVKAAIQDANKVSAPGPLPSLSYFFLPCLLS
jgi:hypothetical protein